MQIASKHWTVSEEETIARIMGNESVGRIEAIQAMQRRKKSVPRSITNLPYGVKAIADHSASGESLGMNVSKESDAAWMHELRQHDAPRFARLQNNMLKGHAAKSGWVVGRCTRCHGHIYDAPFVSAVEQGTFCSRACRDQDDGIKAAYRTRHFTNCVGCGRRFLARRTNNTTCSAKCRRKVCRMSGNVGSSRMSQIPENAPSSPLITQDLHT